MAQRSSPKKKGKMLMNVQLNADDEIDVVVVDKPDRLVEGEEEEAGEEDEDDEESSENLDSDPELVQTEDGRLVLDLKRNKSCAKCKKPLKTLAEMEAHKPKCPGMVDEVTDVILKEMKAAKYANPSDEFHKYCNPNPEHPCYCCGEDISTAHVGHIRCRFCPKSFKAYEYLDRHMRSTHSESDEFPCSFCNAKCPTAEIQTEHLKTHTEGKPFACTICGKEFTRRYHLERHVKYSNCGSDEKSVLPCEVCGKEFARIDNLREHLRTHMGQTVRKRDYQCPYCPKSFYGSSLLNIHIRTHTGERPFPCDLCPKSFPSSGALRKHRRKHTGERPYHCDECTATFAARETLNRHRKTHTGVKPHECKECGKRFIQATQLRTHMFVHTGTAEFQCKVCGKLFPRNGKLNEHMKYEHQGHKPFECNECGKQFLNRTELQRHIIVHTASKEFKCSCGNSYVRKSSLKTHMKTHTIEEPASCKFCKSTYIRMDCLLRHVKKKHPEHLEELIKYTEQRKREGLAPSNAATVEINGEVFEITAMEETPKEPQFVLPDPLVEPVSDSVTVLEVIELPTITSTAAPDHLKTSAEVPCVYELLPISEETEVVIDGQETFQEVPAEETVASTPVKKSPVKVEAKIRKIQPKTAKTEETVTSGKAVKPNLKTPATSPPKVANTAAVEPPAESKPSSPVAAKGNETKPKSSRTPKESPSGATKEPVKRKRTAREPKPTGSKKKHLDDDSIPIFLSDDTLAEKISELLMMLVGEEMLQEFGWPETPVEDLLCQVIMRCGHRPTKGEEAGDKTTRMRENTKILFSVTMDDEDIKPLLNNHTVDEVIMHVLKSK
uniref:C2H2-type domain-containing protein n=2 Tax=Anopheles atroparvus TaxID=41427 RepID=A0AAG5CXV4_ANOAO